MEINITIPNSRIIFLLLILVGGTCLGVGAYMMFNKVKEVADASSTPTPTPTPEEINPKTGKPYVLRNKIVKKKDMWVYANQKNDTGIYIGHGHELEVRYVSGEWAHAQGLPESEWSDATGKSGSFTPGKLVTDADFRALIGYINRTKFLIGNGFGRKHFTQAGYLSLAMNDENRSDNVGQLYVSITVYEVWYE